MEHTVLDDFSNVLYQFMKIAWEREYAHKLNNLISSLSMQQSMLDRALAQNDLDKVAQRSDKIRTAVNGLIEYVEERTKSGTMHLTKIKNPERMTLKEYFILLEKEFGLDGITADPDYNFKQNCDMMIKIILFIIFKQISAYFIKPEIFITQIENQIIKSTEIVIQVNGLPNDFTIGEFVNRKTIGEELGDVSLRMLQRIVGMLNKSYNMKIEETLPLKISFRIG